VSYFNLRKRGPEDEPDEAVDEETATEETAEDEEDDEPVGLVGAVWAGISGPGKWLTAHGHPGAAWTLYAGSAWAVGYYGGWVAVGVPAAWLGFVLAFMPSEFKDRMTAWFEHRDEKKTSAPDRPKPEGGNAPTATPQQVYAATLEWICGQIADRNGIHLSDLLAHAHAHGLHTDLDVPAFRAVLEGWGFPIRQQLKVGGRNRPGIHRDDLPERSPSDPSPEESAVATTSPDYPA
jgi:hypothetical protein